VLAGVVLKTYLPQESRAEQIGATSGVVPSKIGLRDRDGRESFIFPEFLIELYSLSRYAEFAAIRPVLFWAVHPSPLQLLHEHQLESARNLNSNDSFRYGDHFDCTTLISAVWLVRCISTFNEDLYPFWKLNRT